MDGRSVITQARRLRLVGEKLTEAIGRVVKSEADFLQNILKTEIAKVTKEKLDENDKSKK